jgi:GMP synthase (glutamine-hydrolysing)
MTGGVTPPYRHRATRRASWATPEAEPRHKVGMHATRSYNPQGRVSAVSLERPREVVVILDFGSQYTQLIARRVRQCHVYCEIHPYDLPLEALRRLHPRGVILSGGPASVYEPGAPTVNAELFHLGTPILGICYGMQLMTQQLAGRVAPATAREYGNAELAIDAGCAFFSGLSAAKIPVWMSHGDRIQRLPPGFKRVAYTDNSPIAAMQDGSGRLLGIQFHPEVTHTPQGLQMLQNFLYRICACSPAWTMQAFVAPAVAAVRGSVGEERVLCALSGGVDSSVTALLVRRAIGERLTCIFVDNGLLRAGEAEEVEASLGPIFGESLVRVDARERFLHQLKGVLDPEDKRKRIGREFIAVFEEEARRRGSFTWLAQGTLYPDVIESVSRHGPSVTIKSHHNVGGLPEIMQLKLVEPLRELFKDEVRELAIELGLPEDLVWRQPFPGPGLAIRTLGEVTAERLDLLRGADLITREEIRAAGLERETWQAFAVLLPLKSVGVMGDERTFEHVAAIRAVTSTDGMTAEWARLPYDVLARISRRITNEVRGINRVVYDISSKPPSTIEWE